MEIYMKGVSQGNVNDSSAELGWLIGNFIKTDR